MQVRRSFFVAVANFLLEPEYGLVVIYWLDLCHDARNWIENMKMSRKKNTQIRHANCRLETAIIVVTNTKTATLIGQYWCR